VGEIEKEKLREYYTVPCPRCNATGRVYIRTYELEVPFGDLQTYYKLDEEIINILRKK
jgi:hypothetical protein